MKFADICSQPESLKARPEMTSIVLCAIKTKMTAAVNYLTNKKSLEYSGPHSNRTAKK